MKILPVVFASVFLTLAAPGAEKAAPARSPADQARDEFNQARNQQGAKLDQARFQQVIGKGLAFLEKFPTNSNVNAVVRDLATWPDQAMRDRKNQAAQRAAYISQLKYEVVNARYKPDLSDEAKAALGALDVAALDFEVRQAPSRASVSELREKIEALAQMPKAGRFMADRELSYVEIVQATMGAERAVAHLQELLKHPEKGVVDAAKRELNLRELEREPADVKLTTLDGRTFDLAQLRGKVVAVYFWSTTNTRSTGGFETLRTVFGDNRKKGFELVAVSLDKAEDQAKVEKFAKDARTGFAFAFDGKGNRGETAQRLSVTSAPTLVLFNPDGLMVARNLPLNQLDAAVKKLLAPAKKK